MSTTTVMTTQLAGASKNEAAEEPFRLFSLSSIIIFALAIGGVGMLIDDLGYAQQTDPKIVTVDELAGLEDGDYVKFTATPDYGAAIIADKVVGDTFLLAPIAGTENAVWVSMKDGVSAGAAMAIDFEGRIVAKDGSYWEIGDAREVDLEYHAKKLHGLTIPENALVLRDGVKPGEDMTSSWVIGIISALILFGYAMAILSALGRLVSTKPAAGSELV